jgi:hypothetical protein
VLPDTVYSELGPAAGVNELFESCALSNHSQGTMQHVKLFVESTAYCLLDASKLVNKIRPTIALNMAWLQAQQPMHLATILLTTCCMHGGNDEDGCGFFR